MSEQVKRYWPEEIVGTGELVVYLQDYAALEAENVRLKNALLAVTARHFAESWKRRTSDAELEQYLSAGIAQLEAECERLRMQLAACGVVALANTPESAAQARQMHPDYMSASCSDVADAVDREMTLRQQRDALAAELAAIKGQEPVGVVLLRKGGGISMLQVELNSPLHPGTKLYTLPAAPEGGEV